MARALLVSKRAEIEAADMLEKPKNPKEADPAAAELLKVRLHVNQMNCRPLFCTAQHVLRHVLRSSLSSVSGASLPCAKHLINRG